MLERREIKYNMKLLVDEIVRGIHSPPSDELPPPTPDLLEHERYVQGYTDNGAPDNFARDNCPPTMESWTISYLNKNLARENSTMLFYTISDLKARIPIYIIKLTTIKLQTNYGRH